MADHNQQQTAGRSGLAGVLKLIAIIAVLLLAMLGVGFAVGIVSAGALGDLAASLVLVLGILAVAAVLVGSLIGRGKR